MTKSYSSLETEIRNVLRGKPLHEAEELVPLDTPSEQPQAKDGDAKKKKEPEDTNDPDPSTIEIGKVSPVDMEPTTATTLMTPEDKKDNKVVGEETIEEDKKTIGKGIHFGNYHRSIRKRVMNIIQTNQNLADKYQVRPKEGQAVKEEVIDEMTKAQNDRIDMQKRAGNSEANKRKKLDSVKKKVKGSTPWKTKKMPVKEAFTGISEPLDISPEQHANGKNPVAEELGSYNDAHKRFMGGEISALQHRKFKEDKAKEIKDKEKAKDRGVSDNIKNLLKKEETVQEAAQFDPIAAGIGLAARVGFSLWARHKAKQSGVKKGGTESFDSPGLERSKQKAKKAPAPATPQQVAAPEPKAAAPATPTTSTASPEEKKVDKPKVVAAPPKEYGVSYKIGKNWKKTEHKFKNSGEAQSFIDQAKKAKGGGPGVTFRVDEDQSNQRNEDMTNEEKLLHEVSKKLLQNYVSKAVFSYGDAASSDDKSPGSKDWKKGIKRYVGIDQAAQKLGKGAKVKATEETITEVSRKTLGSYIKKAHVSGLQAAVDGEEAYQDKLKHPYKKNVKLNLNKANKTGEKREQGINLAAKKLQDKNYGDAKTHKPTLDVAATKKLNATLRKEETIAEAKHSMGGKGRQDSKGRESRVDLDGDTRGDGHIINQLRKTDQLGSYKVSFGDKSSAVIDKDTASKVLKHYEGLRTSIEKEALGNRLGASHASFKDVLAGKPAPKPRPKISLGGSKLVGGTKD